MLTHDELKIKDHRAGEIVGGQGTMNVPSWSPTGASFAFVSYQLCRRAMIRGP